MSSLDQALTKHRSEADYIDRTIATVRNHRGADNCWPQWANIFADEIEDLRADLAAVSAELVSRGEQIERLTRERDELELQSIVGNANLWVPKRQAEARVAQLQQALEAAIELADEGWGYASPYFQEKWHVADDLTKLRAALVGVEAAEEARSAESAETRGGEQT